MLRRVRHRWITGVLERSLAEQTRIQLGLTRQPEILAPSGLLHRRAGQSLEVFNLSSWANRRLPLDQWLVEELRASYEVPRSTGARWVAAGDILPLLDGLDEVAEAYRVDCVEAINIFHRKHGLVRFAVCCRTQEYTAAARLLQVEEAVEVQPPTREQVSAYLASAGGALVDVQAALEADESLWEFLQSPLVLNIVVLTYQDRSADALRAAGSAQQRLALLCATYTEPMVEHRPGLYSPMRMVHWLAWLARSMRQHTQSEFHLDRLTPDWLPTTTQQRLATRSPAVSAGLVVGPLSGLAYKLLEGLFYGVFFGTVDGLFFSLVFGLNRRPKPAEKARQTWPRASIGLVFGLIVGLGIGMGLGVGLVCGGLLFGLFIGLFIGLALGWSTSAPLRMRASADQRATLFSSGQSSGWSPAF
jgi:hypothetical protein